MPEEIPHNHMTCNSQREHSFNSDGRPTLPHSGRTAPLFGCEPLHYRVPLAVANFNDSFLASFLELSSAAIGGLREQKNDDRALSEAWTSIRDNEGQDNADTPQTGK